VSHILSEKEECEGLKQKYILAEFYYSLITSFTLRHYAASWKVVGSRPDEVDFF
jgi:hypothetical protein